MSLASHASSSELLYSTHLHAVHESDYDCHTEISRQMDSLITAAGGENPEVFSSLYLNGDNNNVRTPCWGKTFLLSEDQVTINSESGRNFVDQVYYSSALDARDQTGECFPNAISREMPNPGSYSSTYSYNLSHPNYQETYPVAENDFIAAYCDTPTNSNTSNSWIMTSECDPTAETDVTDTLVSIYTPQVGSDFPKCDHLHSAESTLKKSGSVERRNARERKRIKNVNQAFDNLRKRVPRGSKGNKISKVETLLSAIEYIRALQHLVDEKSKGRQRDLSKDKCENEADISSEE